MYEIYTTRPHLEILIMEGLCPRAQSKKKNAIRSRSGRWVAPQSPFLSRNYEIASLKDPHRASARSILSIFFSSIDVVTHRRPRLSKEDRPACPVSRSPFSLGVIAKSATHYPILPPGDQQPSFSFSLLPFHRAEHLSSYSPRVFIPGRSSFSSRLPHREIDPVSLRLPR